MRDQLPGTTAEKVDIMMFQLACAFGQGAMTMLIDVDAVKALKEHYDKGIAAYPAERWSGDFLPACEWARTLGRISAQAAASRGHMIIEGSDLGTALELIGRLHEFPFGPCPFCRDY